jgi:hypothetical protein
MNEQDKRDRMAEREAKRAAAEGLRAAKRALVRSMLAKGASGYACQLQCKARFGSGVGHVVIVAVQQELAAERGTGLPGAIEQVTLPADVYESPEEMLVDSPGEEEAVPDDAKVADGPSPSLSLTSPHGPNGTLSNMKAIQAWMKSIDAVELHLTLGGKLSVLARHEFNLGGIE